MLAILISVLGIGTSLGRVQRGRSRRWPCFLLLPLASLPCLIFLAQIYKLSQSSLAELARNSVIQSGFEMEIKRHWLGTNWYLPGAAGNEINKVRLAPVHCRSFG